VILVNARSEEAPDKVQAIAQATLAGGGEARSGRAASPLPPGTEIRMGDAPDDARRRLDAMQQAQMAMLAQLRRDAALLSASPLEQGDPSAAAERERRRQILKQLAEIEKRINEENARPRKRYVSPATQEAVYAIYYDALRRRIEARGTRHYPEHQGRKLYGDLVMNITIDRSGHVVGAEVVRSSGDRTLDRQAVAIVRDAAPYGEFSLAMRREADQLVVTSRFRFTREEGLATTLTN
jgi:protein TonB